MNTKQIVIPFDCKIDGDANSEEGFFEGYGSVFGNVDLGGDVVMNGAFGESLKGWKEEGLLPSLYWMHDMSEPIGDWLEMREDDRGLYVKGRLWIRGERAVPNAIKAYNMMMGTGKKGLSIGYKIQDAEWKDQGGESVYLLKNLDLIEVSVVGWGMNPAATVDTVKSLTDEDGRILTKREVEKRLRDAGLSTRQSKAFISGGYDAMLRDEDTVVTVDDRDDHSEKSDQASLQKLSSILKGLI